MRRHITRRGKKRQRKLIIFSIIGIFCLFSAGYAAFSSNFLVSGKGTIVEKPITIDQLKEKKVTEGDGLYEDIYETDNYIYKGSNPDNYISFNNELWRIISVGSDNNLKIIRNDLLLNEPWDKYNTRNSTTSTYCSNPNYPTCNAWAATTNLIGSPNSFTIYSPNGGPDGATTTFTGTVTADASLNTYLNTTYYNELGEYNKYIELHTFSVGSPGTNSDTESIATDIKQEKLVQWQGYIGLINITDLLKIASDDSCSSLKDAQCMNNNGTCKNNNWLWKYNEFTISPYPNLDKYLVWNASNNGCIYTGSTESTYSSRPVLYLMSTIKLSGKGTEDKPYIIVN